MDNCRCSKIVVVGKVGSHQRDIVYRGGISPTLCGVTCEGGYNNQPKILVVEDT